LSLDNTTYDLSESDFRTTVLKRNIVISFLFKGGSILVSFLLVPMMIHYLTLVNYGVWLLITSVVGWSVFFDFVLGNGLKNKFAEAIARNELEAAKDYVSSAYGWIAIITGTIFAVFFFFSQFIDWNQVLNVSHIANTELNQVIRIVFALFFIRVFLSLITALIGAIQLPAINEAINFLINLLSLGVVYFLMQLTDSSMVYLSITIYSIPVLLMVIASVILFRKRLKKFRPTFMNIKWRKGKDLMSLGGQFFIIQLAGIILFSTDNFIIAQLLNPEEVTIYNLAFRFFGLITIGFSIISIPCWSAYTEAYHKQDYEWIKQITSKLVRIWGAFLLVCILMLITSKHFYYLWVGDSVHIPFQLSAVMALYVCTAAFSSIFVTFVNGVGKIRLQLIFSIGAGITNIPLSIFFAKTLELGSLGVILATIICLSYGPFVSYFQYKKIINHTATGIWNK